MFPKDWTQPCGNCCTKKYAGVFLIPWRIFCKKGCSADGDTWDECLEACSELCYKDPVLKDRQWTSFIDRSPGDDNYSLECFHACASGCGFKFGISSEKAEQVQPNRPLPLPPPAPPPPPPPPSPLPNKSTSTVDVEATSDDLPATSA